MSLDIGVSSVSLDASFKEKKLKFQLIVFRRYELDIFMYMALLDTLFNLYRRDKVEREFYLY